MKSWFKHYNNAHIENTIVKLQDEFGFHKGYSMYFLFIEYCYSVWDGTEHYRFNCSSPFLAKFLGCRPPFLKKFMEYLHCIKEIQIVSNNLQMFTKNFETFCEFPKLLKIQDKDSKYNRKRIVERSQVTINCKKAQAKGSEVWLAYSEAYESRYKLIPTRNAKVNAICEKLIKQVGLEKAINIVKGYLKINDSWYLRSYHKLDSCLSDYQKILTSLETGLNITNTRANQIDQMQTDHDAVKSAFQDYKIITGKEFGK